MLPCCVELRDAGESFWTAAKYALNVCCGGSTSCPPSLRNEECKMKSDTAKLRCICYLSHLIGHSNIVGYADYHILQGRGRRVQGQGPMHEDWMARIVTASRLVILSVVIIHIYYVITTLWEYETNVALAQ
jgi:hypothetical protein